MVPRTVAAGSKLLLSPQPAPGLLMDSTVMAMSKQNTGVRIIVSSDRMLDLADNRKYK